ncbi:uncharacterized protein LOC107273560 [Cephus cinctus]|uniref:Uncharacterized protein LOC107273560 n=1 Tax=Cephus cinctus TaxID=211228 RepID=A0AAJ7CCJ1_CEPCN|nr:uncharacterized protein LOC107273560 [Cephus cinctus]
MGSDADGRVDVSGEGTDGIETLLAGILVVTGWIRMTGGTQRRRGEESIAVLLLYMCTVKLRIARKPLTSSNRRCPWNHARGQHLVSSRDQNSVSTLPTVIVTIGIR